MATYCIVHFEAGNNTAVVSQSWIRHEFDNEDSSISRMFCWWPPFKTDREISIAADQHMRPIEVGNGCWARYCAKIVGKPFQTYNEARQKWDISRFTSDVNSDTDTSGKKRKTRKFVSSRRVFTNPAQSSSEEEHSNSDGVTQMDLPTPPPLVQQEPLRKRKLNSMTNPNITLNHNITPHYNPSNFPANTSKYTDLPYCNPQPNSPIFSEQVPQYIPFHSPSPLPPSPIMYDTPKATTKDGLPTKKNSDFEKQTTRTLAQLNMKLQMQGELLNNILVLVQGLQAGINQQAPEMDADLANDAFNCLPLKNQADLDQLELQLGDAGIKNKLAKKLSQIGGSTVADITRRIFKHLMVDTLAQDYSWLGFKKKKRFDKLLLKDAIFAAVRLNPLTRVCTDKEIEEEVKNWLRHAKFRSTKN